MMFDPMCRGLGPVIGSVRPEARPSHIDKLFTEGDALYEAMLASIGAAGLGSSHQDSVDEGGRHHRDEPAVRRARGGAGRRVQR